MVSALGKCSHMKAEPQRSAAALRSTGEHSGKTFVSLYLLLSDCNILDYSTLVKSQRLHFRSSQPQ